MLFRDLLVILVANKRQLNLLVKSDSPKQMKDSFMQFHFN